MTDYDLEENVRLMAQDKRDALRWRKLIELCGHLQDDSQAVVKLSQDDATRTAFITVSPGRTSERHYFQDGCGFEAAIDSIPEEDLS